ncbi:MAG: glycyl-radical enzyme activating protein [Thermodesulfobacteriota bacterium]
MSNLPLVVDVKRHSLEDGPGIRSVVFFKGCPLRCIFCHNPETQVPGVEIAFSAKDCIRCGNCKKVCPSGAIDLELHGRIHRDKCTRCGRCASVCPGNGLRLIGSYYPVETLTELLLRDRAFYRHSGGGVTLSGGECTLYPDYVETLLKSLKARDVHIVLETAGYFDYDTFKQKILPYIDLIYYDIKIADAGLHSKYIGKPNQRILENFRRLLREERVEVHPRIPLVPGITSTKENLSAIVDFLYDAGADSVALLPYNSMWLEMAVSLGRPKPPLPEGFMKPDEEREVYAMFREIIEKKGKRGAALAPASA